VLQTVFKSNLLFARSKSASLMLKKDRDSIRIFFDFKSRYITSREYRYLSALRVWKNRSIIFFTAIRLSLCRFFRFSRENIILSERAENSLENLQSEQCFPFWRSDSIQFARVIMLACKFSLIMRISLQICVSQSFFCCLLRFLLFSYWDS